MAFNMVDVNALNSSSLKAISEASRLKGQQVVQIQKAALYSLIKSISDNQEEAEPFYLIDLGVVIRLMDKWNQSLPNVKPFYAVKCNTEPALLLSLATLGANFDCASQAEIETILGLGVNPDRIVYANPCKSASHIKYAARVGVNLTTFDSKQEIDKIKKWHPKCELLLRLKVPNESSCWRPLGNKYGALTEEVASLLQHANQAGLKVVGMSFHVGSIASDPQVYHSAIATARFAFDTAIKLEMPAMRILNIGGGFRANPLFDEIVKTVNDSIQEFFSNDMTSLTVIAEPGRYFAETPFILVTNVIGKRMRGEEIDYWIDDGIHGSFKLAANDPASLMYKVLLQNEDGAGPITSSTIFGPTCDSLDVVISGCELSELQVNDLIVFYNMGAYTTSFASKFNGFNRFDLPTYLAFTNAD
ncbi:ornithine decarboxylase isoform X2 [Jatropha curcas]|uniref:ornithine decarboxylase isoform X2 n=1 Tax=Jatropha curcas TaxID=180498 RepID=UPI0018961A41|nr:ornithine decarboxylase isoform X2 [Jatropha curcas]